LIFRTEFLVQKVSVTPFYSKFISGFLRRVESEDRRGMFCLN